MEKRKELHEGFIDGRNSRVSRHARVSFAGRYARVRDCTQVYVSARACVRTRSSTSQRGRTCRTCSSERVARVRMKALPDV
jgi:hypothetical protein